MHLSRSGRAAALAAAMGALTLALLAVNGCQTDPCARVRCDEDRFCDGLGVCRKRDGGEGAPDAGGPDAGRQDGGGDGGCAGSCPADAPYCEPSLSRCVRCLEDAGCGALAPYCDRSLFGGLGGCVACRGDPDCACPTPRCDGTSRTCVAWQPPDAGASSAESCASAKALGIPACERRTSFVVDTSALADDEGGSCTSPGGKEAVYQLTLTRTETLTVTARGLQGAVDPSLVLRRAACAGGAEVACADQLGGTETLKVTALPPGEYFLLVDSYGAAGAGPTEVTLELGDACDRAAAISFPDGGASTTFVVDTAQGADDHKGSCNPSEPDSRERVFKLSLPTARDVRLTARPLASGGDSVLYLRAAQCGGGAELACVDRLSVPEVVFERNLAAGDYWVFVEGYGAAGAGPTEVTVQLSGPTPSPAPNDTCATARELSFPTGQDTVRFTVDTWFANDDHDGGCNDEPDSREVVYKLPWPSQQTLVVTTSASDAGFADPVVYLREGPCSTGRQLACEDDLPPTPEAFSRRLDAGEYYLFIETYGYSGSGPVDVTVRRAP